VGRTSPTYRDALRAIERRWQPYRRTLRRRDRPHFDRLFEHGRAHADAAGMSNHDDPTVSLLVAALLEHERRIAELEAEVRGERDRRGHDPAQATLPDAD
jgi:hypothetical protein